MYISKVLANNGLCRTSSNTGSVPGSTNAVNEPMFQYRAGITENKQQMSNTSSNTPSRLLPTKRDSEKFATRQGISVTNNKDGSVTYKLPKQYWGDDGVTQGVQTT